MQTGCCYHKSLRFRRQAFRYELDSEVAHGTESEPTCTKTAPTHATLAPGLLCVTCPHLFIVGFEILRSPESVRQPFQLLSNRCPSSKFLSSYFISSAPAMCCYDNACNLCRYTRARDPKHFMDTVIRCDALHWKGHSGCSAAYAPQVLIDHHSFVTESLQLYQYTQDIEQRMYNTAAMENRNSILRRLRKMLPFMHCADFMLYLAVFCEAMNLNVLVATKYHHV